MEGLKSGLLSRVALTAAWKACMARNNKQSTRNRRIRGVSLLELLIAMAILGIIISVAMPSMAGFTVNSRLLSAAEQIHGHLQQARSESVARNAIVYVNFSASGTTTWTYGMSLATGCTLATTTPATAGACVITVDSGDGDLLDTADRVLMRFPSTDYEDVTMAIASFSSGTQIVFNPVRGTSSSGQINLTSSSGRQMRVAVSLLGRVEICSPGGSVKNYASC